MKPSARLPFVWSFIRGKRPGFNALVGVTVRRPLGKGSAGEVVTIKAQSSYYCPEGGHRQGFDMDQGWVVEVAARLATESERLVFAAQEAKGRQQRGEPA